MADATAGLTRRLDGLGGLPELGPPDEDAVIAALRHPTVEGFGRCAAPGLSRAEAARLLQLARPPARPPWS